MVDMWILTSSIAQRKCCSRGQPAELRRRRSSAWCSFWKQNFQKERMKVCMYVSHQVYMYACLSQAIDSKSDKKATINERLATSR